MLNKNGIVIIALIFVLTIVLTGCGVGSDKERTNQNDNQIILKIGHISKATHSWTRAIEKLDEELKERSNGRIALEIYPDGQLGNEKDMVQQLEAGILDLGVITAAELSNHSQTFSAWLMPFLVDTHEQAYQLWTSTEAMALFDTLENNNVKGLGYFSSGFRFYLMKKDPIISPEDIQNKKLRITPSGTILEYYRSLEASPTPMPVTEVYTALQTGVIDGIDIDSGSITTQKFYEIASQFTQSNHMYWIGGILINKDRWNQLSQEDQMIFKAATEAAMKYNAVEIEETEKKDITFIKEQGITIHTFQKDAFVPYAEKLYTTWSEKDLNIESFLEKAKAIRQK